jgi:F-type H+-transporting ATPase subunit gamma
MSDSLESLTRKIGGANDLASVVRTMKALAASSVGQYETAVRSLSDYYRNVELGLIACVRHDLTETIPGRGGESGGAICAVVFGSDQGLVGQFNDVLTDFTVRTLNALPGDKEVWAVGERIHSRLANAGLHLAGFFSVPNSVGAITSLVGQIQVEVEQSCAQGKCHQVYLFHNTPGLGASYLPASQRLLPLDKQWQTDLAKLRWPTGSLPEILSGGIATLVALVREYLFVSLFQTCAESLASENASRLVAMQRAEKNIDDLLARLTRDFNRLRQTSIDEELFDVISGFEALAGRESHAQANARP